MNDKMVCFMGKTIEEMTKEELWEALANAHQRIMKLDKEVDEEKLKTIMRGNKWNGKLKI